jgi:hypothetical protein
MRITRIQYLWYVNGFLTCRKILRHVTSGFTSPPKEGVLRILSPWPGLNLRSLGPVASTLNTTPPRRPYELFTVRELLALLQWLLCSSSHRTSKWLLWCHLAAPYTETDGRQPWVKFEVVWFCNRYLALLLLRLHSYVILTNLMLCGGVARYS